MNSKQHAMALRLRQKYNKVYAPSKDSAFFRTVGKEEKSAKFPPCTTRAEPEKDYVSENLSLKLQGTFSAAARAGNMDALLYMHSLGLTPSSENILLQLSYEVAAVGHLHVLKWFKSGGVCIPNIELAIVAAHQKHDHILEWVVSEGVDVHCTDVAMMAKIGESNLYDWVQARDTRLAKEAAEKPSMRLLKWF
jgi:hypothetical protein